MKILIGGNGSLGKILHEIFSREKLINSELISIRNTNIDEFKKKFNSLNEEDIFIDSMDPNDINKNFDILVYKKSMQFRNFALKSSLKFHYVYLSTAAIYKPSLEFIDENSEVDPNESAYLMMKFSNENLIRNYSKNLFSILRIVNIWDKETDKSFFGDVLYAKKKKILIKKRTNDDFVISYSYIRDIALIVKFIVINKIYSVINISTNNFDTRENIKAYINKTQTNPISNTIGQRIISNVINWESIIKNRKELF